jgi:predicted nucleotidyltransferase component of viral defense system
MVLEVENQGLKHCRFGNYRFSEDLDFTLARAGRSSRKFVKD